MEGKAIGVLFALLGIYALIYPNSKFFDIGRTGDVPLYVKRIAALAFVFMGIYLFMSY